MILLGHMLADLVEAETGLKVDRRFNLGGTLVCYNALKQGGLDAYVEYTGTALTTILKAAARQRPGRGPRRRSARLARGATAWTRLDPFGFENTFAILMRRDAGRDGSGSRTISDLAGHASTRSAPGSAPSS